ncbi:MAG: hypothetical protein LBE61_19545, partial [Burkholderiaceae bacterium]|nr:hypothetical protein [Burkholderiaceae bacterium]
SERRAAGAKRVLPWVLRRLFGDFLRAQKVTAPPGALPASVLKKTLATKNRPEPKANAHTANRLRLSSIFPAFFSLPRCPKFVQIFLRTLNF